MRLLRDDSGLLPTAIEEMVRWTSPSPSKRRTATCDAVLGEPRLYGIRRRERIRRDTKAQPAPGLRSGRALLPRREPGTLGVAVLFEELLGRLGSARLVEPVEWTRSNGHTGIRHLVVALR
jgi:hypothetical protein